MNMTENRFREIIDAYGAHDKRWPESERKRAHAFRSDNPRLAAQICEGQLSVDTALDSATKPDTDSALLMARILKQAQSIPQTGTRANNSPAAARRRIGAPPWKSLAATLILSTGMGFGIAQAAASASVMTQAEALLAANSDAAYSYDWLEDTP